MEKQLFGTLTNGPVIDIPAPPMKRQMFFGDNVLVGTNVIPAGTLVPQHRHPEEQLSFILSGTCKVTTWTDETGKAAGDIPHTIEAGPGAIAWFPVNADHEILMHEECTIMDIFDTLREDWLSLAK